MCKAKSSLDSERKPKLLKTGQEDNAIKCRAAKDKKMLIYNLEAKESESEGFKSYIDWTGSVFLAKINIGKLKTYSPISGLPKENEKKMEKHILF